MRELFLGKQFLPRPPVAAQTNFFRRLRSSFCYRDVRKCSTSAAPTWYLNASGVFVEEVELSPQTVDAARQKLLRYKAEPRYRFIRGLMLHADEPQAEQKARARYFQLRGTRQEGDGRLAEPARAPEPAAATVTN